MFYATWNNANRHMSDRHWQHTSHADGGLSINQHHNLPWSERNRLRLKQKLVMMKRCTRVKGQVMPHTLRSRWRVVSDSIPKAKTGWIVSRSWLWELIKNQWSISTVNRKTYYSVKTNRFYELCKKKLQFLYMTEARTVPGLSCFDHHFIPSCHRTYDTKKKKKHERGMDE